MRARLVLVLVGMPFLVPGLGGCEREERGFRPTPPTASPEGVVSQSSLQPGPRTREVTVKNGYEENAYGTGQGKQLFNQYNCSGCHFQGGGGIGPPLMDDEWIYGSAPENIFQTIVEGRPNGMPAFRGRISTDQVWQLVAYVRSMSGLLPKDIAPGRNDDMQVRSQEQATEKAQPVNSTLPKSAERP
jgi:cytochrome c oxidase cbb3-type subunit III